MKINRDFCLSDDSRTSRQAQAKRKSIISLRRHKEKGSMNSNMGQCIRDSTHRENRYDCVAVVVFTFHKTASISSIDRAQAQAEQNGRTQQTYYQNAKDFGVIDETPRVSFAWHSTQECVLNAECCRYFLPFFVHSMKFLALAFRHAYKCTWQVVTFFVYTKAHLKLLLC